VVKWLLKELLLLFVAATVASLATPIACAQTPTSPQNIDELRHRLEQLEQATRQALFQQII
jgi:Ni/Co efflux regulator RcnB